LALDTPVRMRLELDSHNDAAGVGVATVSLHLHGWKSMLPYTLRMDPDEAPKGTPRRTQDFVIVEPFQQELRYRIVPADGFRVTELPPSKALSIGPMRLRKEFRAEPDGTVVVQTQFDTVKARLTPTDVDAVQRALQGIDEGEVVLRFEQRGWTHLEAGRFGEALAEFRRLAALHPTEALHSVQKALLLLRAGLGEAAREAARRATALEPKASFAHRYLVVVLAHDLLGQPYGPSSDRGGAEKTMRKALELAPQDPDVRLELGELLEMGVDGVRYGSGVRLAEAIKLYRGVRKDGYTNADDLLLIGLFRSGQHSEAARLARELPRSALRDGVRVAATALTQGVAAAVQEARAVAEDPKHPIGSATVQLLAIAQYALAGDLVASLGNGPLPPVFALLRKIRRLPRSWDDTQPVALVRWLFGQLASPRRPGEETVRRAFSATLGSEWRRVVGALEKGRGVLSTLLSRLGFTPSTILDFFETFISIDTKTVDSFGARVEFGAPGQERRLGIYLVREGSGWRVLSIGPEPELLAQEALRRATSGDLEGARRWLDWIHASGKAPAVWARFWGGSVPRDQSAAIRAAALLAGRGPSPAAALPVLEKCARAAPEPKEREACASEQVHALARLGRFQEALGLMNKLTEQVRDRIFVIHGYLLRRLGRYAELATLARERSKRHPRDEWAVIHLYKEACRQGKLSEAARVLQEVIDGGAPTPNLLNDLAWLNLHRSTSPQAALAMARRAAKDSRRDDPYVLGTLAALLAEVGNVAEARDVVREWMNLEQGDSPVTEHAYVLGRIAEQIGATDAAIAQYKRVKPPPKPDPLSSLSTWILARRRLAVLENAAK
jgi:tetratricopeptide (TPR) repeat protein